MTDQGSLTARRVLIVEDQYYLAADFSEWLREAGAEVVGPARDIEQACELLRNEPIDTAVIDINLWEGSTFEIARELTDRQVPFLFATGYDEGAIPPEYKRTPRLEKPFSGQDLIAAVQALRSTPQQGD